MWSFVYKAGSPKTCYRFAVLLEPWLLALMLIAFAYGLFAGLVSAPVDYQQGDAYRIIFIHVPAAVMSLMVYTVMTSAVIMHFVWKIKVADIIAKVSAPVGAAFTLLTLVTGSLWGRPTWGTFWIWDARLTSELILLFMYCGIMGIRSAIPDSVLAARASGLLVLLGAVNLPIVHYSVNWWHTLHQGATILKFAKPSIAPSMLYPLLAMLMAYLFYYMWVLLLNTRYELLLRERQTRWVKTLLSGGD